MPIRDALLPEFDHEMAGVRKTLERVPFDKLDWYPHPKSFSMGKLATHLADIPGWVAMTLSTDSIDFAPPGGSEHNGPSIPASREELLKTFDKGVADGHAALTTVSDETLFQNWSLLKGGKTVMTMTKMAVMRGFVLSHAIHHRAQLGVYLRMNDIALPSIYGPSADEGQF